MICRQCGTEIADKALICYRCGTATSEPRITPPSSIGRRRSAWPALLALLALLLAGLFMGQAAAGEAPRYLGYVIAGLAAVALVWRWLRR